MSKWPFLNELRIGNMKIVWGLVIAPVIVFSIHMTGIFLFIIVLIILNFILFGIVAVLSGHL